MLPLPPQPGGRGALHPVGQRRCTLVGFREIGRRRQARIVGDRRYDVVFMDILAEEFESVVVLGVLEDGEGER